MSVEGADNGDNNIDNNNTNGCINSNIKTGKGERKKELFIGLLEVGRRQDWP